MTIFHSYVCLPEGIWVQPTMDNSLDWFKGFFFRKRSLTKEKMMLSCRCSVKPMHHISKQGMISGQKKTGYITTTQIQEMQQQKLYIKLIENKQLQNENHKSNIMWLLWNMCFCFWGDCISISFLVVAYSLYSTSSHDVTTTSSNIFPYSQNYVNLHAFLVLPSGNLT